MPHFFRPKCRERESSRLLTIILNKIDTMSKNTLSLIAAVAALTLAVTDAATRVNANLDNLKSQIEDGADQADILAAIDEIKADTTTIAQLSADAAAQHVDPAADASTSTPADASSDTSATAASDASGPAQASS